MAAEYNQDQSTGLRSELEEPRRTTGQVNSDDFGTGTQEQQYGGGYGGVSENEPPHHKLHSDDEPLPMPAPGTYNEDLPSSEPRETEQVVPTPGSEEYSDAPRSTEGYQEYRDTEPTKFDETPVDTQPRSYGTGREEATDGGYADPSSAFPGAAIDRRVEEPGYGYDQKTSEPALDSSDPTMNSSDPTMDSSDPAVDSTTGGPKKEGLMTKIKEKLPGHHKSADTVEPDTTMVDDTTGAPPKKGLITKIKEHLPGHHTSTTTVE